jgi:hypothetical protein
MTGTFHLPWLEQDLEYQSSISNEAAAGLAEIRTQLLSARIPVLPHAVPQDGTPVGCLRPTQGSRSWALHISSSGLKLGVSMASHPLPLNRSRSCSPALRDEMREAPSTSVLGRAVRLPQQESRLAGRHETVLLALFTGNLENTRVNLFVVKQQEPWSISANWAISAFLSQHF